MVTEEALKDHNNRYVMSSGVPGSQLHPVEVKVELSPCFGSRVSRHDWCFSRSPSAGTLPFPRPQRARRLSPPASSGPWCSVSPGSSRRTRLYPQPLRGRKSHPQRSSGLRSRAWPRSSRARFPQPRSSRARFPQPKSFLARFAQPCSQGEQRWRVTREPTLGPAPSSVPTAHSLLHSGQRFGYVPGTALRTRVWGNGRFLMLYACHLPPEPHGPALQPAAAQVQPLQLCLQEQEGPAQAHADAHQREALRLPGLWAEVSEAHRVVAAWSSPAQLPEALHGTSAKGCPWRCHCRRGLCPGATQLHLQ